MDEIEEQQNRIAQNQIMIALLKEEGTRLRKNLKSMKRIANKNKIRIIPGK